MHYLVLLIIYFCFVAVSSKNFIDLISDDEDHVAKVSGPRSKPKPMPAAGHISTLLVPNTGFKSSSKHQPVLIQIPSTNDGGTKVSASAPVVLGKVTTRQQRLAEMNEDNIADYVNFARTLTTEEKRKSKTVMQNFDDFLKNFNENARKNEGVSELSRNISGLGIRSLKAYIKFNYNVICPSTIKNCCRIIIKVLEPVYQFSVDDNYFMQLQLILRSEILKAKSDPEYTLGKNPPKNPCTIFDIKHCIDLLDDVDPKTSLFSCIGVLCSYSGMRRISVSNLRLGDISVRESHGDSIVWFLNVKVIKGDKDANHKLCFENELSSLNGNKDKKHDNPTYWMCRYLKEYYGINFLNINKCLSGDDMARPLFPLTHAALYTFMVQMFELCGYPHGFFCFHSLRSGFLINALLKLNLKEEDCSRELCDTLTIVAKVAAWKPYGKSMMSYVQMNSLKIFPINRLVNEGVVRSLEINCATDYHGIESLRTHQLPSSYHTNLFSSAASFMLSHSFTSPIISTNYKPEFETSHSFSNITSRSYFEIFGKVEKRKTECIVVQFLTSLYTKENTAICDYLLNSTNYALYSRKKSNMISNFDNLIIFIGDIIANVAGVTLSKLLYDLWLFAVQYSHNRNHILLFTCTEDSFKVAIDLFKSYQLLPQVNLSSQEQDDLALRRHLKIYSRKVIKQGSITASSNYDTLFVTKFQLLICQLQFDGTIDNYCIAFDNNYFNVDQYLNYWTLKDNYIHHVEVNFDSLNVPFGRMVIGLTDDDDLVTDDNDLVIIDQHKVSPSVHRPKSSVVSNNTPSSGATTLSTLTGSSSSFVSSSNNNNGSRKAKKYYGMYDTALIVYFDDVLKVKYGQVFKLPQKRNTIIAAAYNKIVHKNWKLVGHKFIKSEKTSTRVEFQLDSSPIDDQQVKDKIKQNCYETQYCKYLVVNDLYVLNPELKQSIPKILNECVIEYSHSYSGNRESEFKQLHEHLTSTGNDKIITSYHDTSNEYTSIVNSKYNSSFNIHQMVVDDNNEIQLSFVKSPEKNLKFRTDRVANVVTFPLSKLIADENLSTNNSRKLNQFLAKQYIDLYTDRVSGSTQSASVSASTQSPHRSLLSSYTSADDNSSNLDNTTHIVETHPFRTSFRARLKEEGQEDMSELEIIRLEKKFYEPFASDNSGLRLIAAVSDALMEYYNNKFPPVPVPVPTKRLKRKFVELDDAGDDDEVERKGQFYELLFDIHGDDIDDTDLAFLEQTYNRRDYSVRICVQEALNRYYENRQS